jgi:alkanesulfonate monooxygenase SsuD/methylene tetrahydromethanopterin reductase-like flavin-dependent oxidoreductase (luciferase family)
VLIQAGQSGRGRKFAARWAELVFVNYHNLEHARTDYAGFKQLVAEVGRDPDKVFVSAGVYTVVASTRAEAEDKVAMIDRLPKEIDQLSLLCEVLNVDLAQKPIDEPWSEEEIQTWTGAQGLRDRVYRVLGKRNPTTRDFMQVTQRGTFRDHPRFVGSPKDVADGMEEWFATGACDGFVVAASHVPGGYEEFVRYVVPELQRRGLMHNDYRGRTLRENLGLERPSVGAWRQVHS